MRAGHVEADVAAWSQSQPAGACGRGRTRHVQADAARWRRWRRSGRGWRRPRRSAPWKPSDWARRIRTLRSGWRHDADRSRRVVVVLVRIGRLRIGQHRSLIALPAADAGAVPVSWKLARRCVRRAMPRCRPRSWCRRRPSAVAGPACRRGHAQVGDLGVEGEADADGFRGIRAVVGHRDIEADRAAGIDAGRGRGCGGGQIGERAAEPGSTRPPDRGRPGATASSASLRWVSGKSALMRAWSMSKPRDVAHDQLLVDQHVVERLRVAVEHEGVALRRRRQLGEVDQVRIDQVDAVARHHGLRCPAPACR